MSTTAEPNFIERLMGANWKTTLSMWGATLMAALAFIAQMSYDQGPLSLVFSPEYKPIVTKISGIAALVLFFYNGMRQKDKTTTGGAIQQDASGNVTGVAKEVAPAAVPKYPLK